ncbi:MAG: alpha/beta fold hydrolase [Burkholderiaceae bacterium]
MTSTPWPVPRYLSTSSAHRVAFRVVGERSGVPWLLLHGGPGASCQPGMLSPLDPGRQWAVAPDQRGCGASRPRGSIARNTTQALVSDLEALRRSLGVERWNVLAGSWGTVVALAYAQRHPQCVGRMVLRGAFAVSRREMAGLLQPTRRVVHAVGFEPRWPRAPGYGVPAVLSALGKVVQSGTLGVAGLRAVRHWNRLEMACALAGMRKSLRHAEATHDLGCPGASAQTSARCNAGCGGPVHRRLCRA